MTDKQKKNALKQIVSKRNDLIQKVRFDLSAQEQKIIAYMVSKIMPTDTALNYVHFRLSDFLELSGSTEKTLAGGSAKKYLKDALKALSDKSFWIMRDDGKEVLCRWIHKVMLDYNENIVLLRLDEDLMPMLIGLGENFTKYPVFYILQMTSGYSMRLYDLLKSEQWLGKPILYKSEEVKQKIGADKQKMYGKNTGYFVRKCIDPAIKEINELTDIKVRYKVIKSDTRGNPISHLQFFIRSKQGKELEKVRQTNEDRRGGQVHMETPATNSEAFPIAELAENIEDLQADYGDIPDDWKDCTTIAQLQEYGAKKGHKPGWVYKATQDILRERGVVVK